MSVLRNGALALVLALAPLSGQASTPTPGSFLASSQIDRTSAQGLRAVRLASAEPGHRADAIDTVRQTSPLPFAGWLLGALFIGLAVAELRQLGSFRT